MFRKVDRAAGPASKRNNHEINAITVDFRFEGIESDCNSAEVSWEDKMGSFVANEGIMDDFALPSFG